MDERAALERQQRLARRRAVGLILFLCVLEGRAGQQILQFQRGDRDAVDEQHRVDGVLVLQAVADLADDAEDVGLI